MPSIAAIGDYLQQQAPLVLAESWDQVGLLVGDPKNEVTRMMTCLTLSPNVAEEAILGRAQLIVSHHPLPFRPITRLTTAQTPSRILWQLARAGISVYSAHTAFDSATRGINQRLAQRLGLQQIKPLQAKNAMGPESFTDSVGREPPPGEIAGVGRCGEWLPENSAAALATYVKQQLQLERLSLSGPATQTVRRVAIACGSGGSLVPLAIAAKCQALITGDIGFHDALEATANGVCVLAIGHYQSERFAMEELAVELGTTFPDCDVWASAQERDPFVWL